MHMTKFVVTNAEGRAAAFYDAEINAGNIPDTAVEIPDDVWAAWIQDTVNKKLVNGALITEAPILSAHDSAMQQIIMMQNSITPRMIQEAAIDSTLTGLGQNKDKTAKQFIADIHSQISELRATL